MEMQYLVEKLKEHKYVYFTRTNCEETTLEDIFFAHPGSINMLNIFLVVLVVDSTYKTNMYKMSLFKIIGVTSTNMTYSVTLAFLASEKEGNYTWVLEMLVGLLSSKLNMSMVVITNRDNAMMNDVAKVLPETDALLCYFHIGKNVGAKCVMDYKVNLKSKDVKVGGKEVKEVKEAKASDVVNNIMRACEDVVESPTNYSYTSAVTRFRDVCKKIPKFLEYVETTILNTAREKFVKAWTDGVLHLGYRTTNIVESAHRQLKKYLRSSVGYLTSCLDEIDKMLAIQLSEILESFWRSRNILEHMYKGNLLYSDLEGCVSRATLSFIFEEEKRSKTFNFAKKYCSCVLKTLYGLPCACILAMKIKEKLLI